MAIADTFNFIQINDRIATAGQPTEEQLADFAAAGYEAVINLAPHDAENFAIDAEPGIVAGLGLDYVHIPIQWDAPSPEHYQAFCNAMEGAADKKVLVHCAANYRVSAIMSSWAIAHLGWSTDQADALLNSIWESNPDWSMNDTWQSFIDTIRG